MPVSMHLSAWAGELRACQLAGACRMPISWTMLFLRVLAVPSATMVAHEEQTLLPLHCASSRERLTLVHCPVRSSSRKRALPLSPVKRSIGAPSRHHHHRAHFADESPTSSRHWNPTRTWHASAPVHSEQCHDSPEKRECFGEASEELVCSCENNGVTLLHELLESSSWENACSRCCLHLEEAQMWVV